MEGIAAMFVHRPYVVVFLATFVVLVWTERGLVRGAFWLGSGTFLGWLSEFSSVNTGFPFGNYAYHAEQFESEIWFGPVPLFASLSFAFMSYFAFSAARRILSRWEGSGLGATTPDVEAAGGRWRAALLAAVIGTWMDTVIDPLTLVGEYWFLGDLYHYDPAGSHFGVPMSNYGGWMITIGAIVVVNQWLDRMAVAAGLPVGRGPALPFEPFWGIACCTGVFVFMLGINAMLLARGTVPDSVPLGEIFVSGAVLFVLFVAFVAVMVRRGFGQGQPARIGVTAGAAK